MARNNCEVQYESREWIPKPHPRSHWHPTLTEQFDRSHQDVVTALLEEMWQMPDVLEEEAVEQVSLAERFREQAEKWQYETGHLSSPTQRMAHPSYLAILGMGAAHKDEILRLLLRDLETNRRAWFGALSYIAQDNPIQPSDAGKLDRMISAWLKWGKRKGLL
jgi:hypothetical protein